MQFSTALLCSARSIINNKATDRVEDLKTGDDSHHKCWSARTLIYALFAAVLTVKLYKSSSAAAVYRKGGIDEPFSMSSEHVSFFVSVLNQELDER